MSKQIKLVMAQVNEMRVELKNREIYRLYIFSITLLCDVERNGIIYNYIICPTGLDHQMFNKFLFVSHSPVACRSTSPFRNLQTYHIHILDIYRDFLCFASLTALMLQDDGDLLCQHFINSIRHTFVSPVGWIISPKNVSEVGC